MTSDSRLRELWKYVQEDDVERIESFLNTHAATEWLAKRNMGATALHVACRSGCVGAIQCLLKHGADVNSGRTSDGATPLILACKYGQANAVKKLLSTDIPELDLSRGMKYGVTALHSASKAGHAEVVKLLLAQPEVDPEARMTHGATPLYLSAENNHLECLQLFLELGADCEKGMSNGCTPLFIASQNGHHRAVQMLLKHAHDNGFELKNTRSALFIAAQQGHARVVKMLLEMGVSPNAENSSGVTALCVCVLRNRVSIVDLLLEKGANANAQLRDGSCALSLSVQKDRPQMLKRLLAVEGIVVNQPLKDGATPLHIASFFGRVDMMQQLVHHGANVNAKRNDGITPLYFALQNRHYEAAKWLLSIETDPPLDCSIACSGCTPLYLAAAQPDASLVDQLIRRGADVNARLADGGTPVLLAASLGHRDVVLCLCKAGADTTLGLFETAATPLHAAVQAGHEDVVRLLLTSPAVKPRVDVDEVMDSGATALHLAVASGRASCVEVLLRNGARHDVMDTDECVPLYVAAHKGHRDIVGLLLRHGADPNKGNELDQATPLHICAHAEDSASRCDIARLLILRGAKIDAVMVDGATPLYVACYEGAVRLMQLLLDFGASPDGIPFEGPAPLHVACEKRNITAVVLLLKYGANPNVQMECGATPLFICAEAGFLEGARALLQYNATVGLTRREGTTALWAAAYEGHEDLVILLASYCTNLRVRSGRRQETVIDMAERRGHAKIASLLRVLADTKSKDAMAHLLTIVREATTKSLAAATECDELRGQLAATQTRLDEVQVVALARPHEFEVLKWIAGNEIEAVYHVRMKRNGVKYTMKAIFDFERASRERDSMFFQELCVHRVLPPHPHVHCPLTHFVANPAALGIPKIPEYFTADPRGSRKSLFLVSPICAMNLVNALREDFSERPLRLSIALRWSREICLGIEHLLMHKVYINSPTASDILLDVPQGQTVDEAKIMVAGFDRAETFKSSDSKAIIGRMAFGVGCILFQLVHPQHRHPLSFVEESLSEEELEDAVRECRGSEEYLDELQPLLMPRSDDQEESFSKILRALEVELERV